MPIKLAVDELITATGAAGVSAYTEGLVRALDDVAGVELTSIGPVGGVRSTAERMAWRERHLPRAVREVRADALLVTVPELPFRALAVPAVIVVHDVFALSAPALVGERKRRRTRFLLPGICARATRIACDSEAARIALHNTVGVAPEKTSVLRQGDSGLPSAEPFANDGRPYLLYVGELYRRKNLPPLLAALRELPDLDLLMAGPARAATLERLRRALTAWHLDTRVRHLGFVSPERLAALYAGAAALVLPSVEEGFGRPLLDAMALGTPAVVSDIPALRELAGDAALYVPAPLDPGAWREAITRALDGDSEARLRRGRERAARFTWPRAAAEMATLMREMAR